MDPTAFREATKRLHDLNAKAASLKAKAVMKKDDDSIAEEIETARRELLHVQAEMEKIAGSGTAHQVGASLQGMTSAEANQVLQPWQHADTEE